MRKLPFVTGRHWSFHPDDLRALSELGRALTNLERLDEATEQLKKVLEMDPEL